MDAYQSLSAASATAERRQALSELLSTASDPLTGSELAARFGVSRQVIVQDIAVLRASGLPIQASPRGYWLAQPGPALERMVVAVRHTPEQTEDELLALVDAGVEVEDVIVAHPLYGELRGALHLASRADVAQFMAQLRASQAHLLSELTDGLHLHTLAARRRSALERAREVLRAKGYLVE
ncbi:transcription repressor NadR [Kallotenue papyrolyticum]|uniref:transcription repressor NadR n=1 Tax=Kallotenue papyrolyticum TaxID=1325125 RepID=UPI000472D23A|nr:transcription repressor NadR [Kallotenue papyrolyticum]